MKGRGGRLCDCSRWQSRVLTIDAIFGIPEDLAALSVFYDSESWTLNATQDTRKVPHEEVKEGCSSKKKGSN